ncbi:MAG: carbamoyltransferase HypF [Pyrinomonadaceae bacterium]
MHFLVEFLKLSFIENTICSRTEKNFILQRLRLTVRGIVQGVGFRPFVYACAESCDLRGFVGNESGGVFVEIEGLENNFINFQKLLRENAPPLAHITSIEIEEIPTTGDTNFNILESRINESENTLVSPDVSVCDDCLREMLDETDRRFRYPFINCTNCGTRFTIIKDIPYDRPNTTMSVFQMCELCQSEYDNPFDRRFHAQPNACQNCGAQVWFVDKFACGNERVNNIYDEDAILATQKVLSEKGIVAIKGIGGFHLACDAKCDAALQILRDRKGRVDKPFAVMCRDLEAAESFAEISEAERAMLTSKERPIVLLRKKQKAEISELVAPNNLFLGVMLPYSPIHYLLLNSTSEKFRNLDVLVMTSGNFSNEPIVKDNAEALEKLSLLADAFLLHDRDIFVSCDDSVIRVFERSRITDSTFSRLCAVSRSIAVQSSADFGGRRRTESDVLSWRKTNSLLCRSTSAIWKIWKRLQAFEKSVEQMRKLFRIEPEIVAFDKHPNYLSARWAKENSARIFQPETKLVAVQHHHAHIASVMAENGFDGAERVIGFAFDGTGYGDDGAIWGGEVLAGGLSRI